MPDINNIPDSQKHLYQYDLQGNFIKKFKNIYEAEKILKIDKSGILNCIQGRNISANGFMWTTKYIKKMKPYKQKQAKEIVKFDYNGHFIKKYKSMKAGLDDSLIIKDIKSIQNCCYGKIEYTKDGIWRFYGEPFDKYPLHKYCLLDSSQKIVYSSIYQKELANYLNIDFRYISMYMDKNKVFKSFLLKKIDVNNIQSA